MRLTKRILKWSMLTVPVLVIGIGVTSILFAPSGFNSAQIADASIYFTILWLIIALILLGILKLVEKLVEKARRQANEKTQRN